MGETGTTLTYVHTCDCCASSSENERSVILSCKAAYRGKYWVTPLTYKYTGVHGQKVRLPCVHILLAIFKVLCWDCGGRRGSTTTVLFKKENFKSIFSKIIRRTQQSSKTPKEAIIFLMNAVKAPGTVQTLRE